jgi:hypothetical protein
MERIERLLAIEEIRNLRIKYAHLLDTNNTGLLGELFTADAICDAGRGQWEGRATIVDGMSAAFAEYDRAHTGLYPFHHVITNHWVECTGPGTAEGRAYLVDVQTGQDQDRWILLGTYADEYRREAESGSSVARDSTLRGPSGLSGADCQGIISYSQPARREPGTTCKCPETDQLPHGQAKSDWTRALARAAQQGLEQLKSRRFSSEATNYSSRRYCGLERLASKGGVRYLLIMFRWRVRESIRSSMLVSSSRRRVASGPSGSSDTSRW